MIVLQGLGASARENGECHGPAVARPSSAGALGALWALPPLACCARRSPARPRKQPRVLKAAGPTFSATYECRVAMGRLQVLCAVLAVSLCSAACAGGRPRMCTALSYKCYQSEID